MSEEIATDSSPDLKKRARRRLVGAAASALFAVIVLPLVMDGTPKPTGQEIQIRIPSQESSTLTVVSPPTAAAISSIASIPLDRDKNASAPSEKLNVGEKATIAPVPVAVEKSSKLNEKPSAVVSKPDTVKIADVARAEDALAGKEEGQWMVQLGAYQNAANVKQLVGKLKEMHLNAVTEKVDMPQGSRIRVRSGPFNSKDSAEKARIRIKKIGIDGVVAKKQ